MARRKRRAITGAYHPQHNCKQRDDKYEPSVEHRCAGAVRVDSRLKLCSKACVRAVSLACGKGGRESTHEGEEVHGRNGRPKQRHCGLHTSCAERLAQVHGCGCERGHEGRDSRSSDAHGGVAIIPKLPPHARGNGDHHDRSVKEVVEPES